ncbi:MAG: hypothetical protein MUC88_07540, partial [Planctomycetes bacterium]|nr:hypothetical protein [Planctomycetota bacterium]
VAAVLLPMARAERSNKEVSATPQTASVDTPGKVPVAESSDVFVDPNTGITFRKARTLSGPSDVIESTAGLRISPNGKLLLSGVTVVPLDGGQPFALADVPGVFQSVWSPNGKKVAFVGGGAWVIPVDPETGRPTGPAEKVRERGAAWAVWSPDSEELRFLTIEKKILGFGAVSLRHSHLTEGTDGSSLGKRSPDGKQVAFVEFADARIPPVLSVKRTAGGPAEKVADDATPILWSADSEWLVYSIWQGGASGAVEEPRFFRLADGHGGKVRLPTHGTFVGLSSDEKKLFCYCSSYDLRESLGSSLSPEGRPVNWGANCRNWRLTTSFGPPMAPAS